MKFPLFSLAQKSLLNRKGSAILTLFSIAFSVLLFVGVEKINEGARTSFENTISGTDLIVGARTGQTTLLLYTVFQIGEGVPGISWESYEFWKQQPQINWTVPLSLGDSHRGFRVLGTTNDYFEHYRYGQSQALEFARGGVLETPYSVVIGSEAAATLDYQLGQKILISHGLVSTSFAEHKDAPFEISGILKPTGTPIDRLVIVSLEGLALAHEQPGAQHSEEDKQEAQAHEDHAHEDHEHEDQGHEDQGHESHEGHDHGGTYHEGEGFEPKKISAFLVGMQSRPLALRYQNAINTWQNEPLMAILPGFTLSQLWGLIGNVELVLLIITGFVIFVGLMGMMTNILTSVRERSREIAVLRAVGARPGNIFSLLIMEAALLGLVGAAAGLGLYYGIAALIRNVDIPGLALPGIATILSQGPGRFDLYVVGGVVTMACLLAVVPGLIAYRKSLSEGLTQEG